MEAPLYETLNIDTQDIARTIEINRPDENNAINHQLLIDLTDALLKTEDEPGIKVIVLKGFLKENFCTGMDLKEVAVQVRSNRGKDFFNDQYGRYYEILNHFTRCSQIVISQVEGEVNGGGMGFVAAADLVIASPTATFGLSEMLFGLLPACVMPFLIRRVGFQKAYWLTFNTQPIDGKKAEAIGLVDELTDNPEEALRKNLLRVARLNRKTIKNLKDYMHKLRIMDEKNSGALEVNTLSSLMMDNEVRDNICNFIEKGIYPWQNKGVKSVNREKVEEIFQELATGNITEEQANLALEALSKEEINNSYKSQPSVKAGYENRDKKIAIIGMSARFPGAENIEEFWENICEGRDGITEVPKDRWDIAPYYHPEPNMPNKSYSKWGGFLKDVDRFDPLFFGISPIEAEAMDPQQRIFLEEAYHTIENAGYDPTCLSNRKCGVFMGAAIGDYMGVYNPSETLQTGLAFTGLTPSILVGRISYFLNLKGPAISIDTACSSSLVAISMACQSILANECDMALAGGISLMHSPLPHIHTSQAGMLSKEGRCKAFSNSADGIVLSEGVGIVLLKPYSRAIEDHDHIYAVIQGWGANQDGHTNGITAPSAESQTALESHIYREFHIDPETIQYIEAHGTGTKLGDPIEVRGLTDAFRHYTKKRQYCAIGSVKSNIGHTTMAAGVAGLIKAALCLKHRIIPPTVHCDMENNHINFEESPFYVNRQIRQWEETTNSPRQAGVSSFGYSGTNAHVVLREHLGDHSITDRRAPALLILLSARDKDQLKVMGENLLNFLNRYEPMLSDMAYTLQTGREAMAGRIAFMVNDSDQVKQKLTQYLKGEQPIAEFWENEVKNSHSADDSLAAFVGDENIDESINEWIDQGKIQKLAELWVKGVNIHWNLLYKEVKPKRIPLPTYPFARERYWMTKTHPTFSIKTGVKQIHPLLHENTSTLEHQQYTSTFVGTEFYLQDHRVLDEKVLPGVAYLEMARAAVEAASPDKKIHKLKDIQWIHPIKVTDRTHRVSISLYPETDGIGYEVTTEKSDSAGEEYIEEEMILHSQGKVIMGELQKNPPVIDIQAIKARCAGEVDSETCYQMFKKFGITYGLGFQGIRELVYNDHEVLAMIQMGQSENSDSFYLHPGLLDSAFQVCIGLGIDQIKGTGPYMPFTLQEIEILEKPLVDNPIYVHVTYSKGQQSKEIRKYDITIVNDQGETLIRIIEFTACKMMAENRLTDEIDRLIMDVKSADISPTDAAAIFNKRFSANDSGLN